MDIEKENRFYIVALELFTIILITTYIAYLLGFVSDHPLQLLYINQVVKIGLAFYLLYRFNKYRSPATLQELDKVIICSIGIYIFLVSFSEFFEKISDNARSFIVKSEFSLMRYFQSMYAS
jgi:hypothetical protein